MYGTDPLTVPPNRDGKLFTCVAGICVEMPPGKRIFPYWYAFDGGIGPLDVLSKGACWAETKAGNVKNARNVTSRISAYPLAPEQSLQLKVDVAQLEFVYGQPRSGRKMEHAA